MNRHHLTKGNVMTICLNCDAELENQTAPDDLNAVCENCSPFGSPHEKFGCQIEGQIIDTDFFRNEYEMHSYNLECLLERLSDLRPKIKKALGKGLRVPQYSPRQGFGVWRIHGTEWSDELAFYITLDCRVSEYRQGFEGEIPKVRQVIRDYFKDGNFEGAWS